MTKNNKDIWDAQYKKGKHINSYPFSELPSCVFRKYGKRTDKSRLRVLEVGSGAGNNLWFFAREGFDTYGIESSPTAICLSRKLLEQEGVRAKIIQGSFADLSAFADSFFDLVLDRCSLYCVEKSDFYKSLGEIQRVLKRGGNFLSFMYSDKSGCLKYGKKIGTNTYGNFMDGPLKDIGTGHFVNKRELIDTIYKGYFIEYIRRVRYDYVCPLNENEIEIFITMGTKG